MRLKSVKMEYLIWDRLRKFNPNVNEAIRNLFDLLKNEVERGYFEGQVEKNKKLFKENEEKLKNLPKEKEKAIKEFESRLKREIAKAELQKKALELKMRNPEIIMPSRAYEQRSEWLEIEQEDYKQALASVKDNIKKLKEALKDKEKIVEQTNGFDSIVSRLKDQNDRILKENARFEKIIEGAKMLDLMPKTEYIG